MGRVAAALLLCGFGCTSSRAPVCIPAQGELPADKSPEQLFNERWAGKSEDDVLVQYGKPTDVSPLTSGNHVDSYRWRSKKLHTS